MSGGWEEWEKSVRPSEAPTMTAPELLSRRQRRRAAKRAAAAAEWQEKRRRLDRLERLPGLGLAIAAVVFLAVVLLVKQNRPSAEDSAGGTTQRAEPSSGPSDATEPLPPVIVDPHAGAEVLPPRTLPGSPPSLAVALKADQTNPVIAARAFGQQACAWSPSESDTEYADRLSPFAAADVVSGWQHGSGPLVRCMQLNGALDASTPNPTTTAVVHVTAVQVYKQPDGELRAYRWSITPTLTPRTDGTWEVTGA